MEKPANSNNLPPTKDGEGQDLPESFRVTRHVPDDDEARKGAGGKKKAPPKLRIVPNCQPS